MGAHLSSVQRDATGSAGQPVTDEGHETHLQFTDLLASRGSLFRHEANDTDCMICKAPMTQEEETYTHITCRYSWHRGCLEMWVNSGNLATTTCPYDRQVFTYRPVLLPRSTRSRQHMAEVMATNPRCRDDQLRAETIVAWRLQYEGFLGIPRAERLRQMAVLLREPTHPNRAPDEEFAYGVAELRIALEEADYEFHKDEVTSAETFLEPRNASLRLRLF